LPYEVFPLDLQVSVLLCTHHHFGLANALICLTHQEQLVIEKEK
jgi:hypothetical protein